MSLIKTTRDELLARKGEWPAISQQTSLSYWWLIKFAQGRIANPGVSHIEALQSHFEKYPRKSDPQLSEGLDKTEPAAA